MEESDIFEGITYQCERLNQPGINGRVHLVTVDLTTPGLELYTTPLDEHAVAAGWQYRPRWAPGIAQDQSLSIMVNGTLFKTLRSLTLFPGDWARSNETVISDHQVSHIDPRSFLMSFSDNLTPHLEKVRPPSPEVCLQTRWGIGGQEILVDRGEVFVHATDILDKRTLIGIDPGRKLLFLAVFEDSSLKAAAYYMIAHGARDATMLDGGDSTCLVIGQGARGIIARPLVYPSRTTATVFGVRAPKLTH